MEPTVLQYAQPSRVSRMAIASFVIGLIALPLFAFVVPALIALAFGAAAHVAMQKSPQRLGGKRLVKFGIVFSVFSLVIGIGFYLIIPSMSRVNTGSGRSYCSANLTGILKSANVYANDNDGKFPVVPYAPYTASLNNPTSPIARPTADAAVDEMLLTPPAGVAGSPMASLWILVLKGYTGPRQYWCRTDPFTRTPAATSSSTFATNFASGANISYSMAYPWRSDGSVGRWWTAIVDASVPLMSDMAPLQGTGTPARVLNPLATPTDARTWSSDNHDGGQNVGWSDAHAGFEKRPDIGVNDDNIFTTSGNGVPSRFGGTPAMPLFPRYPEIPFSSTYPNAFDIIMVPVRNATTGAM